MLLLGLFLLLWVKSPGTIQPLVDDKGNAIPKSIAEQKKLLLGGVEQHMTIRGVDSTKEVLLFLHGGPGNSINAGLRNPDLILEKEFVVVQWDQFACGRSYSSTITPEDMKIDSFISYAVEVSQYLMQRFQKEKIHLLGHSWGSHLGILLIHKHPELFHSYIGMAQSSNKYEGERISFEWVKEKAAELNDKEGMEELAKLEFPDSFLTMTEWNDRFGWQHRSYVNKYGGIEYGKELEIISSLLIPLYHTPEYTISQKINYIQGLQFSLDALWTQRMERTLVNEIDTIQIPVIIVHGLHDYNIPHDQAKDFFNELKAPYKKFYTFEQSAHSPYLEEVDKFNAIIRKELLEK